MSRVKKYLELNSAYRNRSEFPNPADFQVNISQSGNRSQENALDPISTSYPLITFSNSLFNLKSSINYNFVTCYYNVPTSQVGASFPKNIINASATDEFIIATLSDTMQKISNYYRGCVIVGYGGNLDGESRRITKIDYINTDPISNSLSYDFFRITINQPFVPDITQNQQFNIFNATDFVDEKHPIIFIPTSENINNYIKNFYVYNVFQGNAVKISDFDGQSGLAKIDSIVGLNWNDHDTFFVVKENNITQKLLAVGSVMSLTKLNGGTGYSKNGTNVSTSVFASVARPTSPYPQVLPGRNLSVSWRNANVLTGELPDNITIFYGGTYYYTGDQVKITGGDDNAIYQISNIYPTNGNIVFNFPLNSSYINSFISIVGGDLSTNPFSIKNAFSQLVNIQKIVGISGNVAFLENSSYIQPTFFINSMGTPFDGPGYFYFPYTMDNVSPFIYTGSIISNNQATAYNISLVSLTLPNQPLETGGKIIDYPYVYVEFENISTTASATKNLIYSNNPFAYKAVFRVPIKETENKDNLFTRNKSEVMTQTMIFKQTDSVKITIKLMTGEIFQTIKLDNPLGAISNSLVQISALFSIQKV
jgi:hypothetical protein